MSIEEKQLFTNSDTLKSYTELLNATNPNDLKHISESRGYFDVNHLPEKLEDIFEYSASVYIFVPNPESDIGHWCLFTCLDVEDDRILLEYFNPQQYYIPYKEGASSNLRIPEPIVHLIEKYVDNNDREVHMYGCPTTKELQHFDTTSCGRWCILRQQMLHLEIQQWFDFIINLCDNSKISTEDLLDAFVCPVVGEYDIYHH